MNGEVFIGLINNAALLLALGVLYDLLPLKPKSNIRLMEAITGITLGLIGIVMVVNSWRFGLGIIFDPLSILLSLAGLFFGLIPTMIAIIFTGLFRFYQGGAGTWMGLAVILTSAGIGLAWRHLRTRWFRAIGWLELYGFGLATHGATLLWAFMLPQAIVTTVFNYIALPVMLICPVGTVLLGKLLARQQTRREAEQLIRAQEERYRLLFENSGEAILLTQPDGKIYAANPVACRIFGRSEAEICALGRGALVDSHDPRLQPALETRRRTGKFKGELNFVRQDGAVFPGELSSTLFRDADGTEKTSMFIRDIAERKQAEEALRESEQKYSAIFDNSPFGMALTKMPEVTLVSVNDAFLKLFEFTRLEVVGKTSVELGIADADSRAQIAAELQARGCVRAFEVTRTKKSGAHCALALNLDWVSIGGEKQLLTTIRDITKHKQAEEALRESEERYRLLVEKSPYAIGVHQDGKIVFANPAAAYLFGAVSVAELIGRPLSQIVHPDGWEAARDRIGRMLQGETGLYPTEDRYLRLDGSVVPVEVTAAPFTYHGRPAIQVIALDITERKRAEEALRESQARFQRAVADAPFPMLIHAEDGEIVVVNQAWTEITGYVHQDIPTISDWTERAYGARKELVQADIDRLYNLQGRLYEGEYIITTRSGEQRIWEFSSSPVGRMPDGRRLVLSMAADITARKRVEEKLRDSEQKFSILYEKAPFAVILSSLPNGRIEQVNETFETLFGYSRQEVVGKTSLELGMYPDPEARARSSTKVQEQGFGRDAELKLRTKSGQVRDFLVNSDYVKIGNEKHILVSAQDITERKQAEEEIRKLNAELEQRVRERTAQLEAINRELETFTYSVSHDLKAPLRGIDGYSRLLLADYADKLDDEGRMFLHTIRQATVQMSQLIEDLLAYSRLERRSFKRGSINLPALIESLLREYADEIEAGGMAVTANVACTNIAADPDGLAMAVRNLLDNALKFTRNIAAPTIEIGGRETETSCIIWVRDNGIGFDMKFHDRIFDIFQRLHRIEEYPGTGIGLAIVHKAVTRLGGRVWAESEPGQGAAFYIEIPRNSAPDQ